MRVNVYAEEMTDRIEIVQKQTKDGHFTGLRFYLELPVTIPATHGNGHMEYKGPFMHQPGDDDSAAVTFWGKRDLRESLNKAIQLLDEHYARSGSDRPRLGALWPGHGGIYAGVVRGTGGAPDYHLIIAESESTSINWSDAITWAKDLCVHGCKDFSLPTRQDQRVLFANVKELFADAGYWSDAQYAGYDEYAWCQGFYDGYQGNYRKSVQLRARAVRRVPIS